MGSTLQPSIMVSPPMHGDSSHHPRRPPAHLSVSLLHSPKKRSLPDERSISSNDSAFREREPSITPPQRVAHSPSSLQPFGRDSSGESSNAETWFDKSNNDVRDQSAPYADNEPPFFMRNSSSSETPSDMQRRPQQTLGNHDGPNSLDLRTGLLRLGTDGSSTEDFRGVIDDLTIENKRLKRKLKRYEKVHDSHLKNDKLFEVRIHGLSAEKKRELEETLRKFTDGLGKPPSAQFAPNGYQDLPSVLRNHKTASSQMSMNNTDSAYASMSASGQGGSSGRSAIGTNNKNVTPSLATRQQNIHSFLHQIPEGLLPQPTPAPMSEHAKQKLVVKRLEQIFAGKGAAPAGHHHMQLQEEVSQMAARADRSAMEAEGQRTRQEGNREARIMQQEAVDVKDEIPDNTSTIPGATIGAQDFAMRSPQQIASEQRPTRPLDLDPHRAQISAENINYIRHLGFSPPDPRSSKSPEEGHGWVYLNLLINMAQLHTINVTTKFIRKALNDCSEKFEMSSDGRKVRWKGGRGFTRASSSGKTSVKRTSEETDGQSARKRPKLSHWQGSRSNMISRGGATQRSGAESSSKFAYTPMFFHKDNADETDDSSSEADDDAMSSGFPASRDCSAMASSGLRATSTGNKKVKPQDDGPIIFYNNARFCTDLSGERKPEGNWNAPPYLKIRAQPIGKPQTACEMTAEKRGPLAEAAELPEPMDLHDNPIPSSLELTFPPTSPLKSASDKERTPVKLEVTGIGGVWPADNFAIHVESRHARIDQTSAPEVAGNAMGRTLPPKLAQILHGPDAKGRSCGAVHKQLVSFKRKELPPSDLPPALSFLAYGDDSAEEDESDVESELSVSSELHVDTLASQAPQPIDIPFADSDDEENEEDEDEEDSDAESDASLDFLAAARELDPESIRAQEREYDANMAERLAEEIPAGSSAATAGGGSGFASPASNMTREAYQRAVNEARAKLPAGLQPTETSDSMRVLGLTDSGSDDGDDDDNDDDDDDGGDDDGERSDIGS